MHWNRIALGAVGTFACITGCTRGRPDETAPAPVRPANVVRFVVAIVVNPVELGAPKRSCPDLPPIERDAERAQLVHG